MSKRTGLKVKTGVAAGHGFINTKNHNRSSYGLSGKGGRCRQRSRLPGEHEIPTRAAGKQRSHRARLNVSADSAETSR